MDECALTIAKIVARLPQKLNQKVQVKTAKKYTHNITRLCYNPPSLLS